MTRPQNKKLSQTIKYLESIGLSVYGPCIDLESGEMCGANMDFDAEDVLKYRHLVETDSIIEYEGH